MSDNLEYNQRSLTNVFLGGTHVWKDRIWELDWKLSPTLSTSDDPDIRKTAFTLTSAETWVFSSGAGGNPSRIWRSLLELNAPAKINLTRKYDFRGSEAKLKFGLSHTYKIRKYEIVSFDMQFSSSSQQALPWPDPDPNIVLAGENVFPYGRTIYYNTDVQYGRPNPNEYSSNVNNTGFYISNEFQLSRKLKSTLGIRAENYVQRHTGRNQQYASGDVVNGKNLDNDKVLSSFDLFPALNFIYSFTELQNLRLSYTRTIARPSFKELSFAQIIDPLTNRIFNGGLYAIDEWEGNLRETYIDNIDLRWELFLAGGQIISASAFYKRFKDPIELVRVTVQQTSSEYQPRNVGNGFLYGVELELRKNLDFVSDFFADFNISGNFTYVQSQLEMTESEYDDRKAYERDGETIDRTRVMAGQAPYVVNAGITYGNRDMGLDAGLFYNVKGPTLTIVGSGLIPDVYALPFNSLNFSLNKKLGAEKRTTLEFTISNIMGERVSEVYRSYQAADMPYYSVYPARSFGIGLKYKL
jgi:outer membrane receptor protein involved in Fe transport